MPRPTPARQTPARLTPARSLPHKLRTAFLATVGILGGVAPLAQAHEENMLRTDAANCIDLNKESVASVTPLRIVFNAMEALPVTGNAVAQRLQDPAYKYQVCLDPTLPRGNILALYINKHNRLVLPMGKVPLDSFFHEAFHAYQDTRGGLVTETSPFVPMDMAVGLLLSEASAVGYTLMILREAAFTDSSLYTAYIADDTNAAGMGKTFDAAFNDAYALHAAQPEDTRRAMALQAGGTAVVESLLSGHNRNWNQAYTPNALAAGSFGDSGLDRTDPMYVSQRNEVYRRAGLIGDSMTIVPARFLGPEAEKNIQQALSTIGISTLRVPRPDYVPRRPGA